MEAGDSAAGDGDEQRREQVADGAAGRGNGVIEAGECGHCVDAGVAADDADECEDHHAVEQEGAQVVTGLQEDPYRSDGGDENVHAADDHPCLIAEVDGVPVQTENHAANDEGNADNGGNTERSVSSVNEEAEEDSDDDEEDGDHRGACVCCAGRVVDGAVFKEGGLEGVGDDGSKCGNDEQEGQVSEGDEQTLCLETDTVFDNGADGLALIADGCEQSAEVMHAAEEDTAYEYPKSDGDPAENSGLDRSVYGACARDRGEMVSHKHGCLCGNIVNTIFHGVSRSDVLGVYSPLFCQPSAVEYVAYDENGDADYE